MQLVRELLQQSVLWKDSLVLLQGDNCEFSELGSGRHSFDPNRIFGKQQELAKNGR
jgi:hypothetical protein